MCDTDIDWSSLSGAKTECRKLYLKEDNEGLFKCPVVPCDHNGFATKREFRKHLHSKQPWYFYLDNKTQDKVHAKRIYGQDTTVEYNPKKRTDTKEPHLPIQGEICEDLINWLCAACGGGMSSAQTKQIVPELSSFCLKYCCENDDVELSEDLVDYCLGSPNFIEYIENNSV